MNSGPVSDQDLAERAWREAEAQYRAIFENVAIGVVLVDLDGHPVRCNPTLERLLGYSEKELQRMAFPEFTHPEDLQADLELYRALVSGERDDYQIEKRYLRKDGQTLWALLTISLVGPDCGAPQFIIGTVEDITARKLAEQALRESEEKFFKAFHGNPNPTVITRRSDGLIFEANEAFGRWFGVALADIKGRTSFDFGLWKSVPERAELLRLLQEKGSLIDYEKIITLPTGEIRTTLLSIQPLVIGADSYLLTISNDITQQKHAERALQESEARLRRALTAARMGIWERDLASNRVEWSEDVHRLFGLAPGAFAGTFEAFVELVEPEDRERVRREIADALRHPGHEYYSEMRVRWPDRSRHWLEGRGQVQRDETGKAVKMRGTVVDITDRKGAEFALRESEERFRSLAASAFEGIGISDGGLIADVNDQMAEMLGYRREELIGRAVRDLVAPESRPLVEQMMATGQEGSYEHLAIRKDGSTFPVEVRAKPLPYGGRQFRVTSIRDITARKNTEAALRSSEESLRATIENTPYVAVQWYDADGRILFWNHASEIIFGWTAREAVGKTLEQLIFTPAEAAYYRGVFAEVERTGNSLGPAEYRFHRRDGSPGVCISTTFRIPFAAGKSCFVCMDVDITKRKQAEQSLREAQERELRAQEEFARQLLNTQEQERQRLASELHDGLGQSLSIIKNHADLALAQPGLPATATQQLEAISRFVAEALVEVRGLAQNLRPLQIEQLGLTDSLCALMEKVAASTTIRLERRLENVDDVIRGNDATHMYRIIQEALNNLVKHSGATRANLRLERDVKCVRLEITDNGGGFEVKNASLRGGLGLTSIGERARMLGGSLKIKSVPGEGTSLIVELPIADAPPAGAGV